MNSKEQKMGERLLIDKARGTIVEQQKQQQQQKNKNE